MTLINFGRNSIAIIIPQYLTLESGFAVSSQMLSYIVNTQSAAMIFTGLVSGWFGRSMGNAPALVLGSGVALGAVVLFALSDSLVVIFGLNLLRGFADVIILATSYAFSSVLIPPDHRARYFAWFNATFFFKLGGGRNPDYRSGDRRDDLPGNRRGIRPTVWHFAAASALTLLGVIILSILLWKMRRKSPTIPRKERDGLFGEKSNHPAL